MNPETDILNRHTAIALLRQFICIDQMPVERMPAKATVQQAILLMRDHSDYQILGICADTAAVAIAALHSYLKAFGFSELPQPEAIAGVVYLKYNPKTGLCYLKPYEGEHRGVLVSCQSAYDEDVNETFGHLPLDLFENFA
ncbi:MAG: DUF1824 family protein [Leptolyngbyaceae cyanobacterium bins.349]|nr:DUF1824 family protein [Leptolyngbyaceae cyanobacterium bins.349]